MRVMTAVAMLIPDSSSFTLSEDDQEDLELALSEIQSGNYTDGRQLLSELKDA
jgi:hypothetical protein